MSSVPPSSDPLLGQLVSGRYRIVKALGEGGMGRVYLAEHEAIEKQIALKVLHREYSANPEVVERFKQEAISASRIKHPNVIDVFDFGQLDDGSCFIAMEFLEGQDLGDALARVGAFDPEQAIRVVLQVCRALGTAHARGVVHRDMKPENIFLQNTPEGEQIVKIVDFGIAQLRKSDDVDAPQTTSRRRLTKTGMIFGTPEYMAPEQARGQGVDARSDVYATGVILYELLTGSVPFMGQSFLEVLNHHVHTPPAALRVTNAEVAVSPELEAAVMSSLAKQPHERFGSMKEFAEALSRTPEGAGAIRSVSWIGGGEVAAGPRLSTLGPGISGGAGPITMAEAPAAAAAAAANARRGTEIHGSMRAPTPVAGSRTIDEIHIETPKQSVVPWIIGGVFAVVIAAGAILTLGRHPTEEAPTADKKPVVEPPVAPPTTPTSPPATPTNPPSVPAAAPQAVVLHVVTTPPGAVIEKNGFQVCAASPCDVTADPGEAVELKAKLGAKSGSAKVLAQREQDVTIALGSAAQKPRPATPAAPSLCEVEVDGLKILRPCK